MKEIRDARVSMLGIHVTDSMTFETGTSMLGCSRLDRPEVRVNFDRVRNETHRVMEKREKSVLAHGETGCLSASQIPQLDARFFFLLPPRTRNANQDIIQTPERFSQLKITPGKPGKEVQTSSDVIGHMGRASHSHSTPMTD